MIRNANESDIPRIVEIRAAVHENKLRVPSRVTVEDLRWFIANPGIFVWEEEGGIVVFRPLTQETAAFLRSLWTPLSKGVVSVDCYSTALARC